MWRESRLTRNPGLSHLSSVATPGFPHAGRIVRGSHKLLSLWLRAVWHAGRTEPLRSASSEPWALGSGQTAWTWLHRLRRGRERLQSALERMRSALLARNTGHTEGVPSENRWCSLTLKRTAAIWEEPAWLGLPWLARQECYCWASFALMVSARRLPPPGSLAAERNGPSRVNVADFWRTSGRLE
jgi:hypothetical protein